MTPPTDVTTWDAENNAAPFRYGTHLVLSAWPRLWTMGNRAILTEPLLAFFCSSQCPGDVILRTYDLARALRDAGVAVVGGFHSPMEKECLDLLLRGNQPVVLCPARSIENMQVPASWKVPLDQGRLLVVSPFVSKHRRPTVVLAEQRNRLVAELAAALFIAHAAPRSKTEAFSRMLEERGRTLWTFDNPVNALLQSPQVCRFASADAVVEAGKRQKG